MLHNPALLLVGGQALESQGIIDTWAAEVSAMQALATAASTTTASNKHKGVKTGLKWFIYQGYMCKICIYIYIYNRLKPNLFEPSKTSSSL